jgi:hypothetical protein
MSHVRELRPRSAALDCSVQQMSFIHINGRPVVCKLCAELWASRVFPSDLDTSGIAPGSFPAGFGPGGLGTIAPGESLTQRYGTGGLLRSLLPSGIPGGFPSGSLPAGFGLGAGGIVSVIWAPAVSLRWFGPAGQIVSDRDPLRSSERPPPPPNTHPPERPFWVFFFYHDAANQHAPTPRIICWTKCRVQRILLASWRMTWVSVFTFFS